MQTLAFVPSAFWAVPATAQVHGPLVAGIVNITPDSFSDGGQHSGQENLLALMHRHLDEGANMLDLGAESTRPGASPVPQEEEIRRLAPVMDMAQKMVQHSPAVGLSIDTYKAGTAAWALEGGAHIINDISGGAFDANMLPLVAEHKPGYVLGHCPAPPSIMQQAPTYSNVVEEVLAHFTRTMNTLVQRGMPEERIVLDPCIGFGKTLEHNLAIIRAVPRLLSLGRPLYFGLSRKRMLGELTGLPVEERGTATAVATALLASKGVLLHRVHHVAPAKHALLLACQFAPQPVPQNGEQGGNGPGFSRSTGGNSPTATSSACGATPVTLCSQCTPAACAAGPFTVSQGQPHMPESPC